MTPETGSDHDLTPLDLSALGPKLAPGRWDAMVAGAVRAGDTELARRARPTVTRTVVAWQRPVLAAASVAMAAALVLMVLPRQGAVATGTASTSGSSGSSSSSDSTSTVAESIGIPGDWAPSVEGTPANATRSTTRGVAP